VINCLDIFLHIQKQKGDTDMTIGSIIDNVNSTRLKNWVDILSSFHTRHTKSNNLENVVNWLNNELQKVCKDNRVLFQNFTKMDQNQTFYLKNLICKKPSITDTENNNTIIIGAHYDSRAANLNNTKVRAPGADDNASGVSGLLELARILSSFNLNYNIELVLFSGEEQGKWGSDFYVRGLNDFKINNNNKSNIDLYLNLDMIGYPPSSNRSNQIIIEYDVGNRYLQNDKNSKRIALLIQQIASNYTGLQAILNKLGNSDFIPFEALGYTVIGIHDEGEKFNPNYHKSSDTANSLNIEYLSSVTKMALATILTLDELNKYMN
ncbi:MAG: M20/M25/M40 family metallo-hydrolase, partial [Nitrososphaeraceae archaeon]|nr:M20/M25/M40 family metallo-hydrolase [Nitrososphaeraceae archaeon]